MNENSLKDTLAAAYAAPGLEPERMEAIARTMRLRANRSRRLRMAVATSALIGIGATAGFAYPTAAANIFAQEMRNQLAKAGPYAVEISVLPAKQPGLRRRSPVEVLVDGAEAWLPNPSPGAGAFLFLEASRLYQAHPKSGIKAALDSSSNLMDWVTLPVAIVDRLGKLDLSKRLERRGTKTVQGRTIDEIALTYSGRQVFLLEVDRERNLPVSMTLDQPIGPLPALRFDYQYDARAVRRRIAGMKLAAAQMRTFDPIGERERVKTELFGRRLASVATGRDTLSIYRVEQNEDGDVFVLYTCRGYHAVEDNFGPWIQLRDERGERWLTTNIDLTFSKLAPKGEGLKAQVFFHPDRPTRLLNADLSLRLKEWEYLREEEPSTRTARKVSLGRYAPARVRGVPTWYFYGFANQDEAWLTPMAQNLRFQHAVRSGDFPAAIRVGKALEASFPDLTAALFFKKADLDRGLAQAYRGVGDVRNAERYERRAKVDEAE